jgi:hypothetical protein
VEATRDDVVPLHTAGTYPQADDGYCEKICNFVLQRWQMFGKNTLKPGNAFV